MEWIKIVMKEVEQMPESEIIEIDEDPKQDIVVGTVPIPLQKFRTVIEKRMDEIRRVAKEHLKKHDDPEYDGSQCSAFHRYFEKEISRIDILFQIFWLELRESISYRPRKENMSIGIRRGWSVVEFEEENDFDFFEGLFKDLIDLRFIHNDLFGFRPGSRN